MKVEKIEQTGVVNMTIAIGDAIRMARSELSNLTGLELSSTLKTLKEGNGWRIWVELVEQHAVPNNMDILATYEAVLDGQGNFVEFSRKGMRKRCELTVEE